MRSVLRAREYSAREPARSVGACLNPSKSFQQGPSVRHTRNQQGGKTVQGSHRSRTACLQDSCGSSLFCVSRDASGGSTRAEQAQAGYVIMFADMSLLAGLAAPVTLVSWRSHRVKRVVASASAAEAMGLSEAIAQGDWCRGRVCANGENEKMCHLSKRSRIRKAITTTYTTKQSVSAKTGEVLLIWHLFRNTCPDHRCSYSGLM